MDMIQNSKRRCLQFLIAMKFVLNEDTSFNFSLKFRGAAQIMQYNNGLLLNSITALVFDIKFLIWTCFKILIVGV
jgi:hypothetical protein